MKKNDFWHLLQCGLKLNKPVESWCEIHIAQLSFTK